MATVELVNTFFDASLEMVGDKFRVAQAQQAQLAANTAKLATLAAGQPCTLGRVSADVFLETPSEIPYAANVTLDASTKNDYVIRQLTGPCAITWSNPAPNRQGTVVVRQDGSGGRAVTLNAPADWVLMRDAALADLAPASGADAITLYTWAFISVGGANVLLCGKIVAA